MNIGIIADTHDNVAAVERAIELFDAAGVEVVVHCGDFVAPPVIPHFEGFELHGVLGNNDGEIAGLEAAFDSLGGESELHGRFANLEFDGLSFAVLHGESKAEVETLAAAETYDVVCYGHHHERECTERGRTTLVNPGGHFPSIPADHRTVAILDTLSESVRFRSVLEAEGDAAGGPSA
ncbi:metallophosphoesterase [Natrarchaeobius oligotrophus]|uniref:Phosphoesterase n=1 Tax=Natrarchaeobius chitinivorans TaxID=1679083 RepID=A0A3N6MWF4_NATCH|nr:metallophosphoesterase [Natrarchaeobius chitinivorans]RQH00722.1 metallophosphoesterase [Natrarchaeobius chitinivorans]